MQYVITLTSLDHPQGVHVHKMSMDIIKFVCSRM